MTNQTANSTAAQRHYDCHFGPGAELPAIDDILSIEQLTHGFRGTCEWELLLATGGPAARVLVRVAQVGSPVGASFEHQDWGTPWIAPCHQDAAKLLAWVEQFHFYCPMCEPS